MPAQGVGPNVTTAAVGSLHSVSWDDLAPRYAALEAVELTPDRFPSWLEEWNDLRKTVVEYWWTVRSTAGGDDAARLALRQYVESIFAPAEVVNQRLGQRLLMAEWDPGPEHAQFVRGLRYADRIVDEATVAVATEISALVGQHEAIAAEAMVVLDGRELTGLEVDQLLQDPNRAVRERVWRAQQAGWVDLGKQIDALVIELLAKRRQLARAVGLSDYRAYAWHELGRLDYTPKDVEHLHEAVAAHIVPVARERYERRRGDLGVEALRPWDLRIDPLAAAPLQPFDNAADFAAGMAPVFRNRDPELGDLFDRMHAGGYLDLGWRPGKREGGSERPLPLTGIPFVSVDGDGSEINVGTLVHEMGHAFHDHLTMRNQRFEWALRHTDEFSELAALGLWWLTEPYLSEQNGGFYTADEARRNHVRLLEQLLFHDVPGHVRTDAFHHWIHTEAPADVTPEQLDEKWAELGSRFQPWIDVSGLEMEDALGWRQHWALFSGPFYDVAYILANLGAVELWAASDHDPDVTWRCYRSALSRGNTGSLPDLYRDAGARLPFDSHTVRDIATFAASVA